MGYYVLSSHHHHRVSFFSSCYYLFLNWRRASFSLLKYGNLSILYPLSFVLLPPTILALAQQDITCDPGTNVSCGDPLNIPLKGFIQSSQKHFEKCDIIDKACRNGSLDPTGRSQKLSSSCLLHLFRSIVREEALLLLNSESNINNRIQPTRNSSATTTASRQPTPTASP